MDRSVEVLPSRLYWAPGLDLSARASNVTYANALEIGHCDGKVATYRVPHYNSYGAAFGPLSLDEILQFCRGLISRLVSHTGDDTNGPLCLTTAPGNREAHTNASVLLGAYLVLHEAWSPTSVASILGKTDAELVLPGIGASQMSTWKMTVRHCWEGLAAARKHGWIDLNCLRDDKLLEAACRKYREMAFTYDCVWLVPGKILISSDPVTTMCDPNPQTFNELWEEDGSSTPKADPSCIGTKESKALQSLQTLLQQPDEVSATASNKESKSTIGIEDASTTASSLTPNSLCTDVTAAPSGTNGDGRPLSFRKFLKESSVSVMIRNNSALERGMPQPSYDGSQWRSYDIEHIDLPFADGAVPPRSLVCQAFDSTHSIFESNGAVLIHCKSGFGRSVALACCLACYHYDIPGDALFGWARIVRPGALNTIEQENFVLSLKGRSSLSRFLTTKKDAEVSGANIGCGCVVQ